MQKFDFIFDSIILNDTRNKFNFGLFLRHSQPVTFPPVSPHMLQIHHIPKHQKATGLNDGRPLEWFLPTVSSVPSCIALHTCIYKQLPSEHQQQSSGKVGHFHTPGCEHSQGPDMGWAHHRRCSQTGPIICVRPQVLSIELPDRVLHHLVPTWTTRLWGGRCSQPSTAQNSTSHHSPQAVRLLNKITHSAVSTLSHT